MDKIFDLNGDVIREAVNFWSLKEFAVFEAICLSSTTRNRKQWASSFGTSKFVLNAKLNILTNAGRINNQFCLQLLQWLAKHDNIASESFHFEIFVAKPPCRFTNFMQFQVQSLYGQCHSHCYKTFSCRWLHHLTNLTELQIYDLQSCDLQGIQRVIEGAPNLSRATLCFDQLTQGMMTCLLGLGNLRRLALYMSRACKPTINLITFHPILQRLERLRVKFGREDLVERFFPNTLEEAMKNLPLCPNMQVLSIDLLHSDYFLNLCPNVEQLYFNDCADWFMENDESPAEIAKIANIVKKMNLCSLEFFSVPIEFVTIFLHHHQTLTKLSIQSYHERDENAWDKFTSKFPNFPNLTSFCCLTQNIACDMPELLVRNCPMLLDVTLSPPSTLSLEYERFMVSLDVMFQRLSLRSFALKSFESKLFEANLFRVANLTTLQLQLDMKIPEHKWNEIFSNNCNLFSLAMKILAPWDIPIFMSTLAKNLPHLQELDLVLLRVKNVEEVCESFCTNLKLLKKLKRFSFQCVAPMSDSLNEKFAEARRKDPLLQKFHFGQAPVDNFLDD